LAVGRRERPIGEPVDPRMKCVYRLKPFLIRIGGRYFYITKDGDYELESCPFCGEKWRKGNADAGRD